MQDLNDDHVLVGCFLRRITPPIANVAVVGLRTACGKLGLLELRAEVAFLHALEDVALEYEGTVDEYQAESIESRLQWNGRNVEV